MAATVRDLLASAESQLQSRKSPLIGLLEGLGQSTLRGVQRAPERALAAAKFQADQAERQRIAERQRQDDERRQRVTDEILERIRGARKSKIKGKLNKLEADATDRTPADPGSRIENAALKPGAGVLLPGATEAERVAATEVAPGAPTPSREPSLKLAGATVDSRGFLKPTFKAPSVSERVPRSFQGILSDQVLKGEISFDEAVQKFRDSAFPQLTKDALGNVIKVTPEGAKRVSPVTASDAPENAQLKLRESAPKLADRFEKILDESFPNKNAPLRQSVEGASAATQVQAILTAEPITQVGLQSLGFYFARMAGSNSQLSDREREVFESPLSLIDSVVNTGTKLVLGDLSATMKDDLTRLAAIISGKAKAQTNKILKAQRSKAKFSLGRFWKPGLAASFPTAESLIVTDSDIAALLIPAAVQRGEAPVQKDTGVRILRVRPKQ